MKLIWLLLFITYCFAFESQENGEGVAPAGGVSPWNLEELVRRMSVRPTPQRATRPSFRSAFQGPTEFESVEAEKRPFPDDMVDALARDVEREEELARQLSRLLEGTTDDDSGRSSVQVDTRPADQASWKGEEEDNSGPYTMMQQQTDTVIRKEDESFSDIYFVAIVAGCCAVGIFGVISAGVCFYRLQKSRKAAADVEYPAYGVTGPCKDLASPNGDRKLAQSAQMYHYQHQKQQMIAVEKAGSTKNTSASDVDSEEENEEGDYTVYECPGLAPAGEMEVKNPLFHDDSTPVSPPVAPPSSKSETGN